MLTLGPSSAPAAADADALCTDGEAWLSRAGLAAAVLADVPGTTDSGLRLRGGVAVRAADPLATLTRLLAVRAAGAVPVVVDADLDDAAVQALVRLADGLDPRASEAPDGAALLVVQTSGSSSRPRAVVRTEASWDASLEPFGRVAGLGPDDVVWAPGALSATLTLFAAWHALATGLPLLLTGRWRGVAAAGPAVARVTAVHCVPAVLGDVLDAHAAGLLPSLRTAVVAGAAVPDRLRERAAAGGVRLVEYYGAAELSFVAVDDDGRGLRPFPGAEVEVRGGEVRVRSPYVALGYLAPDDAGPLTRDADGLLGVGDLPEHVAELLRVLAAVVGRHLHADNYHAGAGLAREPCHGAEVVARHGEWQPAQRVVGAELEDHDRRLVLFQQRRQARAPARGRVGADAGVHHVRGDSLLLQPLLQDLHPAAAAFEAVFGADRVAHDQDRGVRLGGLGAGQ